MRKTSNHCFIQTLSSIFVLIGFQSVASAQVPDTITVIRFDEVTIYKDKYAYKRELERVRHIYPYALQAAKLLQQLDAELAQIESKRKKRKHSKKAGDELKGDYTYVIKDLYRSEGVLLMKLIHRETGMTVAEILKKYKGKFSSKLLDQLSKIWGQDMNVRYDPIETDWLTEQIILEIQKEMITFDPTPILVDKETYKKNMETYRKDVREAKKQKKVMKKQTKAARKMDKKK